MRPNILKSFRERGERERYNRSVDPVMKPNMSIKIGVRGKELNAKTTSCNTGNRVTATANGKNYLCFYNHGSWSATQI